MMNDGALSRRWRGESGTRLAGRVLDRLVAGESPDDLPWSRHEGRVDLRGFATPDPEVLGAGFVAEDTGDSAPAMLSGLHLLSGLVELRDVVLADLDLTGADLEHLRLFDTMLRNCRFDAANCQDWRAWNLAVEQCTFRKSDLAGSALGTWYEGHGNRFHGVDFTAADLRENVFQGASFVDCDFTEARLDGVEFSACELTRCRFGGLLDEVRFRAEPGFGIEIPRPGLLEEVDFSAATLRWVEFRGLSLDRVRLPADGEEHVIVRHYPCVVHRVLTWLGDVPGPEDRRLRSRLRVEAERLDHDRSVGIWHVDELGDGPDQQQRARELLHLAERKCADQDRPGAEPDRR